MKLNKESVQKKFKSTLRALRRYAPLLFVAFLAVIYGFLTWRIFSLSQQNPDPTAITAKAQTTHSPHIDQSVVNKIKQLQDNSVNVQALFDEARSNPFQE